MKPLVLVLVLTAALLHAGWNALMKKGGDPLFRMALIAGGSTICGLPLAIYFGPPDRASWLMLVGSMAVHQVYYGFLVLGYRHGDLSTVYPIARGAAPMLVAIGAAFAAEEYLDPWGIASVVVVSIAVASLAQTKNRKAVGYALACACTIAIYSVIDGLGGRAAGDTLPAYVAWLFVLQGLPIAAFAAIARRGVLAESLAAHWRAGLGGGAAAIVAYGLVIWAMAQTHMSYVAALREISVVLAAIIGTRMLGEPFGRRRIIAATAVAAGVVLLQITR